MNHETGLRADAEEAEPAYRADFAVGEHSARHLRRILRLYLTGWGLLLVAALTDSWGVDPRRDGCGKTVWFECLAAKATDG